MKWSKRFSEYAQRNDRRGYPWHVFVADVLTGWAIRLSL